MEFFFDIIPSHRPTLTGQLATCLDLRGELHPRQKPKKADQTKKKDMEKPQTKRKRRRTIIGISLMIFGAVLAAPSFLSGAGFTGTSIAAILALLVGITYLSPKTAAPPRKCVQMAEKLVEMRQTSPSARIVFSEEGMSVNYGNVISYDIIEGILEAKDLYLIFLNNSAMFIAKDEAYETDCEAFSAFLQNHTSVHFHKI